MIIIAAVDNRLGMMFNQRRVSQDRQLRAEIVKLTQGHLLWMNGFSGQQFASEAESRSLKVDDSFLALARPGDYCFVENDSVCPFAERVEAVILCRWNRDYPADFFFDLPLDSWHLTHTYNITGYSHDIITIEEYLR